MLALTDLQQLEAMLLTIFALSLAVPMLILRRDNLRYALDVLLLFTFLILLIPLAMVVFVAPIRSKERI